MPARRAYRFHDVDQFDHLFDDGPPVHMVDDDGSTVITVSRSVEPMPADGSPTIVVVVDGEVDRDTAPLLHLILAQALNGPTPVCCDLSGVTFFDAAGARAVMTTLQYATAVQRRFFVRGVRGVTERVLHIADPGRSLTR